MSDVKGKMPVRGEGVYDALTNAEPNSSSVVAHERNATVGVEQINKRITATPGDEDKVALDVALSDGNGNSINSDNPLPTYSTDSPADEIEDYDVVNVAKDGGESNHDYVTTAEFRNLNVDCSSAGLARFELQVETAVASGTFATIMTKFNSVSNPNVVFAHRKPKAIIAGITIRVIKKNEDNQPTDLFSSINGTEEV